MTGKSTYEELDLRVKDLERKIVEYELSLASLQKSEDHYKTLVNGVNDGIFVTDTVGRFTFVNKTLATMFGYDNAERLLGKNFLDLVSPEERDEVYRRFSRAVHDGEYGKNH